MAKIEPLISAVNSGEFSPHMEARTDFEQYPNAAKRLRNFTLYPEGGITRRPGSRYVAEVKTSAEQTYLFPFQFSESQSYQIEAGDGYFRFYRRQGQITVAATDAVVTNGTFTSNITDWDDLSAGSRASTVTITIANPGVVTWTDHDLPNSSPVVFTTTGSLPTGITAGTTYYVLRKTISTFQIAATPLGAAIETTGSQSGTHTATIVSSIAHDSVNGRMELIGAENSIAWAEQDVTVGAGNINNTHVLAFRVVGNCNGKVGFQVGTSTGASDVLTETNLAVGYHAIGFTPGATTIYIQFRNSFQTNQVPRTLSLDDVSFLSDAAMEVTSPYSTAALANVRTQQSADVLFLLDGTSRIQRLERRGHTSWSVVNANFEDGPWNDINPTTDLDQGTLLVDGLFQEGLTAWTVVNTNDGFTLHNSASNFAEMDPGTSAASGKTAIRAEWDALNILHKLHYQILDTPGVTVKIGTSAGASDIANITNTTPGWAGYGFTPAAGTTHLEFGYELHNQDRAGIGAALLYDSRSKFFEVSTIKGLVTMTAHGTDFEPFVAADVGRSIRLEFPGLEPAWGIIVSYTSATVVGFLFIRDAVGTVHDGSNILLETWRFGLWNDTDGYPKAMGVSDGRGLYGNTATHPDRFWASQSAQIQNMRPDSFVANAVTVEDDDAIDVTLNSTQINPIAWFSGRSSLIVGTSGGQWIGTSTGQVITPNDVGFKQHTSVPTSSAMAPAQINQLTLFADKSEREVHRINFTDTENTFVVTDLTILADHIFRSPIAEMQYQRRPFSTLICRRDDGRIASLVFNSQHNVLGWAPWIIGGSFGAGNAVVEQISVTPGASDTSQTYNSDERDEVWCIVKRTVNGSTVRYVEFIERYYEGPIREDYSTEALWIQAVKSDQVDAFYVDSGLTLKTPLTITAATAANPVVVTSAAHGLANDDKVIIHDVEGMTELNGNTYTVANKATNTFELNDDADTAGVDGSGFTAYVSGGKAYKKVTSITGLDHLEGETVKVLADGKVHADKTVTSGAITLDTAAGIVHAGLGYESSYESLKLDAGSESGTAVNKIKAVTSLGLLLVDAGKFKVTTVDYDGEGRRQHDLYDVTFQRTGHKLGQAVPLYTGEHEESTETTWATDTRLFVKVDAPVPFTMIGMVPRIETTGN